MNSLSHRYPELGEPDAPVPAEATVPNDALEDIQLASFDAGYQAGWDDAAKAQTSTADRAVIDVAQNLQDMSFSHREAYLKLSAAMKPLMTQIVEKLLPQTAKQLVGLHVVDQLSTLMDSHVETAIEIAVAPDAVEELRALLDDMAPVPFTLTAEPSLSAGQAYLRAAKEEREINLDAVLGSISDAVEAFYAQIKKEISDE